jgi:hypothetical protein
MTICWRCSPDRALLEGHFVLRSGLHSRQFFQRAILLQHTDIAAKVCGQLADKLRELDCDAVISPALGGITRARRRPFAAKMSYLRRERSGRPRQETTDIVRQHGGEVVGVGVARSGRNRPDFACPFVSLIEMKVETFSKNNLPSDLRDIPVNKTGELMMYAQLKRICHCAIAIVSPMILAVLSLTAKASSPSRAGLTVNSAGLLTRHGTAYRGIGVNYYDAFLRVLRDPEDTSYTKGFRELGAHGIPFARFAACGYWPIDYSLYLRDKKTYFLRMDGVVHAAEQAHVGLIPSLFWYVTAISDLAQEPRNQWGNPNSKTRQFMRTYTREFVTRYVASPAIWGWEFSNEVPLALDLPDPQNHLPPIARQFGTPATRSLRDTLTFPDFKSAALDFADTVRSIDHSRILLTGNALPRPTAYHHSMHLGNVRDTEAEFARMLLRDNPDPYRLLCLHGGVSNPTGYFADHKVSYAQLLQACIRIGRSAGKPVYVEEFVAIPTELAGGSLAQQSANFENELSAFNRAERPLPQSGYSTVNWPVDPA